MKPDQRRRLAALKARLARDAAVAVPAAALAPAPNDCFGDALVGVTPLVRANRAESASLPRTTPPRPRPRDAIPAADLSDEIDLTTRLDGDAAQSFRRPGIGPDVIARLRRGQWPIGRQLDLHGLRRDAARARLVAFIDQAARDGLRCLRIVHGQGHGSPGRAPVLKDLVSRWLVQQSQVSAFTQAGAADGGPGALLVLLRSSRRTAT